MVFRLAGSPEEPGVEGNRIELAKVVNKYIDEKLGVVTRAVVSRSNFEGTEEGSIVDQIERLASPLQNDPISKASTSK